jgi:beta-glucanase (GH16 family)
MKKKQLPTLLVLLFLIGSCSKGSDNGSTPAANLPIASINDISNERTPTNTHYQFSVTLDKVSSSPITISYTTSDGTAISNTDYKPTSGTLTIPANTNAGSIDVEVIGDSTRKPNQYFSVQLSNPANCALSTFNKGTASIINENLLYYPVDNSATAGYTTPTSYPGKTLVWNDEFNSNTINTTTWVFETGAGGWGNAELENYTARSQNAFQSKGNLIIEARKESLNGSAYTSARMITKARKVFTFGRIDIRAKVPTGKGIWPAIWMLGNNIDQVNWPACGEMDIMELLGQEPNKIYGTLHWGATTQLHQSKGTNKVLGAGSYDQQFHVYSLVWVKDQVQILVDDVVYNTINATDVAGSNNPFNSDFFFILNVAVGGNWPGSPDGTTVFPQRMVVDYVRVFQ